MSALETACAALRINPLTEIVNRADEISQFSDKPGSVERLRDLLVRHTYLKHDRPFQKRAIRANRLWILVEIRRLKADRASAPMQMAAE